MRTTEIAFCVLFVVYALATANYADVWENELTLWTWAAQHAPIKPRPHMQLAVALMERKAFISAKYELNYVELLVDTVPLSDHDRQDAARALVQNRAAVDRLMPQAAQP